jgi:acyl-CoA reductase-like NAD-dependent aldehyde dehydrogenase
VSTATPTRSAAEIDFFNDYALTIGGELVTTEQTSDVYNPATGEVIAVVPDGGPGVLDQAVAVAKAAFPAWAALSWDDREQYVKRFAEALKSRSNDLKRLLTLEQGKPLHSQAAFEVDYSIDWIAELATRRLEAKVIEDDDEHTVTVVRTPLGVVGAIAPWNYPVLNLLWKSAPCLMAGNTIVFKPSPFTPLCSLKIGEIAQQIFPAGVINVVSGGNELGQRMTAHPDIAKISFTGSTATGKRVMEACAASNLKRVTLELGGNDPAIVLPDADHEALIPTLFWGAFGNSAQWCIAIKRLYVHSSKYDKFLEDFVAFARERTMGDGLDPDTELGPVQNRMQYEKLLNLLADTRDNGYKIALGGEIDEDQKGNFFPVTIVDNPPDDSRVVAEEAFGPILPILRYDEIDEVVSRANNTESGLGSSVWGSPEQAEAVGNRLEAGSVWVNEIHIHGVDIPFGGHKQSGLGVENGSEGLEEFTNVQARFAKKI